MGKACVHFHGAGDLTLGAIGEIVATTSVDRWIAVAQSARRRPIATRST
jgi:hypothetical protein